MANQVIVGKKHKVTKNTPTPNGMLYDGDIVTLTELYENSTRARIEDMMGRIYHINPILLELIV